MEGQNLRTQGRMFESPLFYVTSFFVIVVTFWRQALTLYARQTWNDVAQVHSSHLPRTGLGHGLGHGHGLGLGHGHGQSRIKCSDKGCCSGICSFSASEHWDHRHGTLSLVSLSRYFNPCKMHLSHEPAPLN